MLSPDLAKALKAAGVVWVAVDGGPSQVVWHLWHEGCVWTVVGGAEQDLPGLGRWLLPGTGSDSSTSTSTGTGTGMGTATATGTVIVRGAQRQGLPSFPVEVSAVEPGTDLWDEVVPLLHATRLNAVDGEQQPARWAAESTVLRLRPLP